jgi:hypothetical protein
MSADPTDDQVRAALTLILASLDDPEGSDTVTELAPRGGARLFGVQPSVTPGSSAFVVRIARDV